MRLLNFAEMINPHSHLSLQLANSRTRTYYIVDGHIHLYITHLYTLLWITTYRIVRKKIQVKDSI